MPPPQRWRLHVPLLGPATAAAGRMLVARAANGERQRGGPSHSVDSEDGRPSLWIDVAGLHEGPSERALRGWAGASAGRTHCMDLLMRHQYACLVCRPGLGAMRGPLMPRRRRRDTA